MIEAANLHQNIIETGYAPIPISVTKEDLAATIGSYLGFLELPSDYHKITRFELTDRGDGDFGQFRRVANEDSQRGSRPDNKDIFHFGSMTRQIVEERVAGALPTELKGFLDQTEELYWSAQRAKHIALRELDAENNGLLRALQPERSRINDVLRLIAYYPNEGSLAKGHFDRSTATLAIGESHPGLRMAPGQNGLRVNPDANYMTKLENRMTAVDHHSEQAKFFLGAGWNRLPNRLTAENKNLPLAFHDVINNGQRVGEQVMRWAAVMFINPHADFVGYKVPSQAETRPYKQLGRLAEAA